MKVVALASDLMDRSRMSAAIAGISFARDAAGVRGRRRRDRRSRSLLLGGRRAAPRAPDARIVAFGPHVDEEAAADARAAGADRVWPRSRFFRDPAAALAPSDVP